ncbi:MAG: cobyrinate a,c-diamide synthase [Xanthobacteraceae bacterium]|nr:cobyrinate a,c-diamide synthase [Xanthobacteraceae bacterium]
MTGRGLIIAASHSGAGKTTVALAILAALMRRGVKVRAAKAGPDYIDPAFHAVATGAPSVNLDSWAMTPEILDTLAARQGEGAELLVMEGVMGLFDGAAGPAGRSGATADLARYFGLPVILVLDVHGQSQSAAAVVRGFALHDPAVRVAGVILNRVGSDRHRALITDALAPLAVPLLGAMPRHQDIALPERHLGLVQAGEHSDLAKRLDRLAQLAESNFNLDPVIALAAPLTLKPNTNATAVDPPGQRIALARDQAFSFIYPHLLDGWRRAGAEILPFSPLADEPPDASCDACWLPGGYPELHAGALAVAARFRSGMQVLAQRHPVHGECGGYMVLGEGLEDASGERHAMLGLLGHTTSFAQRKLHLGYRTARLLADSPVGNAASVLRGHEFHYARLVDPGNDAPLVELADAQDAPLGKAGGRRGRVTGTFFHVIATATRGP